MIEYIFENILSSLCDINRYYQIHIKDEVKTMKSVIYEIVINPPQYQLDF